MKIIQSCSTCKKRMTKTCPAYKEMGKRPGDDDWCAGYQGRSKREKQTHDLER